MPSSSAVEYEDAACSQISSSNRSQAQSVTCFTRQATGATPKLNDTDLGPVNGLPTTPTDVAYILNSSVGYEMQIEYEFVSNVSLSQVTLHYYCTGTPPQLWLRDDSGGETSRETPSYAGTERRCLTFNITTSTLNMTLWMRHGGGQFYLTEVEFFKRPSAHRTGAKLLVCIP